MADFKIRVVKNIGDVSIDCFGKVGTEFKVADGVFYDLDGDDWTNGKKLFKGLEEINEFFSGADEYQTVFELAE